MENRIIKHNKGQSECAKKIIFGILIHVFVRIKNIGDASVIECDEIITVMGIVSTKMTNALARSIKGTDSINCHSKKK